jgi:hypothetical protein
MKFMGAIKLFGGHKVPANTTDPNPNYFSIKKSKQYGIYWVSFINYPDARNYEGNKILLTTWDPNTRDIIDPHFSVGGGILARFEPTDQGWEMARMFAKLLLNSAY